MLLPMAQQKILDKKNLDACLYVPGIMPLYMNFNSEAKMYYFATDIDETSQDVIAIPTNEQFNNLKMLDLRFSNSSDIHLYTTDYGINLVFRNLYDDKRPSHSTLKQPFNENRVALNLLCNFRDMDSVWVRLANKWKAWK